MPLFIPCPANGRIRCAVERVGAIRKHLGDGFPLMADANMKWSVDDAIRAARALLRFDLDVAGAEDQRDPPFAYITGRFRLREADRMGTSRANSAACVKNPRGTVARPYPR